MKKNKLLILFFVSITFVLSCGENTVTSADVDNYDADVLSDVDIVIDESSDADISSGDDGILDEKADEDLLPFDNDTTADDVDSDYLLHDEDSAPDEDAPSNAPCTYMFGRPNENTGLDVTQCKPFFNCEGVAFTAPIYSEELISWMESRVYLNPPEEMAVNPYDNPGNYPYHPEQACGLRWKSDKKEAYTLETFDSIEAVQAAGAILTHSGACGHCSSLQSLAVYIKNNDLTGPVKSCTSKGILVGEEKTMECLMDIGFDRICARAWYYNTKNTTANCLDKCLDDITGKQYHNPDGSLNDCIQCDEDKSGPIFKTTSGRTRRNSGLPTALCRPCNTVTPVTHFYSD